MQYYAIDITTPTGFCEDKYSYTEFITAIHPMSSKELRNYIAQNLDLEFFGYQNMREIEESETVKYEPFGSHNGRIVPVCGINEFQIIMYNTNNGKTIPHQVNAIHITNTDCTLEQMDGELIKYEWIDGWIVKSVNAKYEWMNGWKIQHPYPAD